MKLSPLLSEGCVLQRCQENIIQGYAHKDSKIKLQVRSAEEGLQRNLTVYAKADDRGYFELRLTPPGPGKGITLVFEEYSGEDCGESEEGILISGMEVRDAAFGDVFLLSGQSNMVLPVSRTLDVTEKLVEKAEYPEIREFAVPMQPVFGEPLSEITEGAWKKAVGKELLNFGAAGFFMARELYEKYRIPIGLVQTAVGGTPIQAWCSEATVRELEEYTEEMEQCFDAQWVEQVQRKEARAEQEWHKEAWNAQVWSGEMLHTKAGRRECGTICVPGMWQDTELADFHGSLVLERDFFLESMEKANLSETAQKEGLPEAEKTARAYIGAIADADRVLINGCPVGETGYCYPPRKYDFSADILKEGKNTIRIEMMVFRGTGGFVPGKPYYIRRGSRQCSLEGQWNYRIVRRMEELPQTTFFQYKPTALYNGMLSPLKGLAMKALLFYQGESNTHKPEGYQKYFDKALEDWRALFGKPDLPVIYVQLAGFADAKLPCREVNWAVLREEQRKSLKNHNVAMVVALDLGEYNDLHPQRKDELGRRMALAADALVFGGRQEYSGPVCLKMERKGSAAVLFFAHAEGGLASKEGGREIYELELAGEDGAFYEATAFIEGECLVVSSPCVRKPCFARYAWNNFPGQAHLYNGAGLPASPFMVKAE